MSNAIVCGMMKEGKTTLAQHLALERHQAVVMWDPRGMCSGYVVHDGEELQEALDDWRKHDSDVYPQIICYRPTTTDIKTEFGAFCSVLFPPDFRVRNFSCIIDEAAQLQTFASINPNLDRVIRQHPRDVFVVQTCHSLQDFHRASKDLMNDLYIFRLKGRSLDAAVDYCDEDEEFRETIRNLPKHHLVHYTFERSETNQQWEVWDNPDDWKVELDPVAQEMQSSDVAPASDGGAIQPLAPAGSTPEKYSKWVH